MNNCQSRMLINSFSLCVMLCNNYIYIYALCAMHMHWQGRLKDPGLVLTDMLITHAGISCFAKSRCNSSPCPVQWKCRDGDSADICVICKLLQNSKYSLICLIILFDWIEA